MGMIILKLKRKLLTRSEAYPIFRFKFNKSPGLIISEKALIYPICPCFHFRQVYDFLPSCAVFLLVSSRNKIRRIVQHQFGWPDSLDGQVRLFHSNLIGDEQGWAKIFIKMKRFLKILILYKTSPGRFFKILILFFTPREEKILSFLYAAWRKELRF